MSGVCGGEYRCRRAAWEKAYAEFYVFGYCITEQQLLEENAILLDIKSHQNEAEALWLHAKTHSDYVAVKMGWMLKPESLLKTTESIEIVLKKCGAKQC